MVVVVLRRRALLLTPFLVLLALGTVLTVLAWLAGPPPPPRIGWAGCSSQLIHRLFPGQEYTEAMLEQASELAVQLEQGKLDYLVELGEPTPGLISWQLASLVPVVVVPFWDSLVDLELESLIRLISTEPQEVLVAEELALDGYPWWEQPVPYLSAAEVVEELQKGRGRLGIIPLQDRRPAVKVLTLDGIDPRDPVAGRITYPLTRRLFLSRRPKSLPELFRDWVQNWQGNAVHKLHLATQETTWANPWGQQFQLLAVGDIMLNREVKKTGLEQGWEFIFSDTGPLLRSAELTVANLESPIGSEGRFINMFQAPPKAVEGLAFAGVDVVSLANNHALDYHHGGLLETMRLLREYGIDWVGAGHDLDEARAPVIREVDGITVGFVAYTEMWFVHAREPISWRATENEPGVAPAELDYIVDDVSKLRELVDVVVVSIHWGREYVHEPTPEQRKLAQAAAAAGADLVLGHHPHVLQGIEFYEGCVIAYSLGNFVFDLNLPETWETILLACTIGPQGVLDITIYPAYIFGVQPKILQGQHKEAVYRQIRQYSLELE